MTYQDARIGNVECVYSGRFLDMANVACHLLLQDSDRGEEEPATEPIPESFVLLQSPLESPLGEAWTGRKHCAAMRGDGNRAKGTAVTHVALMSEGEG